ncbi:MAG: hypothetical protein PHQ59_00235 [Candidatus Daviesbacteria bacterium]|nr:hypothetical protein [Candidatus Daviesbacteria bacterium]
MSKKILILPIIMVLIAAFLGGYFLLFKQTPLPAIQTTSPNILYLTNPITSFSGKIEAVSGNIITVNREINLPQPNQGLLNKATSKKITYKILIGKNTVISKITSKVPYLFKSPVATASNSVNKQLTNKDLQIGQTIYAISNTDLRTLTGDQLEASVIDISPNEFSINGKINAIKGNELIIRGSASTLLSEIGIVPNAMPQEKNYTITIDQNTEISNSIASNNPAIPSKPEKYLLSDLKKDQLVTIYAEGDMNTDQKFISLRVIPFLPNLPTATPQATQSSTQKPK